MLTSAVQESSKAGEHISQGEWVTAVCACLITSAGVFLIPNKSTQPPAA